MTIEGLWNATLNRDASADGLFVYAVQSTRIYCRPSCPSRKPRRDRVEFFPAAAMAEARGYRACRRCRPNVDRAGDVSIARVRRACDAVARRPDAPWTSDRVARAGGTSVVQLQRAFRGVLGLSPRDYVAACRHRRFLDTLRNGHSVTEAIYEAGYGSPSRVYGGIHLPGMTPATYGRGGQGAIIHWTTAASPIGRIMVAATERGLCFVQVGANDRDLVARLRKEFPLAGIDARASSTLGPLLEAARAVAGAAPLPRELPLDIRGTAFQWRVWRALTRIPRGETRSYAAVAAAIGRPSAVRAVARACATNPIALVVPCHRVVSTNGDLSGYRWGRGVKQALLEAEKPGKEPSP
jgi:AraC family transcriptional regulator of adaptative response/methylated-DNA-[protein]-cysteine methyltransferase